MMKVIVMIAMLGMAAGRQQDDLQAMDRAFDAIMADPESHQRLQLASEKVEEAIMADPSSLETLESIQEELEADPNLMETLEAVMNDVEDDDDVSVEEDEDSTSEEEDDGADEAAEPSRRPFSQSVASLLLMLKPSLYKSFVLPGQIKNSAVSARSAAVAPQMRMKGETGELNLPFVGKTSLESIGGNLLKKAVPAALAAAVALTSVSGHDAAVAGPFTRSDIASLTYEQIKGTGLANTCPIVEKGGSGDIKTSGLKSIDELCLEPLSFQVLEEETGKNGKKD